MLICYMLLVVGTLLSSTLAASCWRNTTCTGPLEPAFTGEWDQYVYSPSSRTVSPIQILSINNSFISEYPGTAELQGNGSTLIFDFGQEVGGIVTVTYNATGSGALGLAFTEAQNWTGQWSDSSNGAFGPDGAIYGNILATSEGIYTMPDEKLRGGFRYLTLFTTTDDVIDVNILNITLEISFQPAWSNLRAYGGYFFSNDELINRIWYAGAYTVQTNAVPPDTGRVYPLLATGWLNDAYLGSSSSSIYVDGSKRDRATWSGDLDVAVPTILVSTCDSAGVTSALEMLYDYQESTGQFPMAGPPLNFYGSDTYHMSAIIANHDYVLYTGDTDFLLSHWDQYVLAMSFITAKIDDTSMLYVTGTADWGRLTQGGHNTEANMLMYRVLTTASTMAQWAGEDDLSSNWTTLAENLKSATNVALWDSTVGAFKNSDVDASIFPEDGNSMALYFDGALASYVQNVSLQLTTNWGPIGAVCPELPGNIVGFVESFEVKGHLVAGQATRSLDLMRLSWGWALNNPTGTNSTTLEGYLADGTYGYRATTGYDNDYSYPSHAHGWGTGPTHALTTYVVGLQLIAPGGSIWSLAPQFGDLTHAEGGFTTPIGTFQASWTLDDGGYTLTYDMPEGSSGTLVLPGSTTGAPRVVMDGTVQAQVYDSSTGLVTVDGSGGAHSLKVTY